MPFTFSVQMNLKHHEATMFEFYPNGALKVYTRCKHGFKPRVEGSASEELFCSHFFLGKHCRVTAAENERHFTAEGA